MTSQDHLGEARSDHSTSQHDLDVVLAAVEALHHTVTAHGTSDPTPLRELGVTWGRHQRPLAPLLLAVHRLTESTATAAITAGDATDVPQLVERLRRNGSAAVRELLHGFRHTVRGEDGQLTAANLLWGGHVPPEPDYAVIALRCEHPEDLGPPIDAVLAARLSAVHLLSEHGGFVLTPAHDEKDAVQLCGELRDELPNALWLAVAWRPNTEIEDAGVQASVVLDLVTNLAEPPGVYGVEDVAVEYALMRDTAALVSLLALIAPVVHQQPLRATVEALVATAGNRSKAASILNIHRSTLDYRLNRVAQLTGCLPTSARGLQTLAVALALHGVVHGARRTVRTPW